MIHLRGHTSYRISWCGLAEPDRHHTQLEAMIGALPPTDVMRYLAAIARAIELHRSIAKEVCADCIAAAARVLEAEGQRLATIVAARSVES